MCRFFVLFYLPPPCTCQKTGEVPGVNGHPAYHNRRTHWWDASFIYGSNPETMARTRTGAGGKIHAGKDGVMDHNDAGVVSTGDNKNSWVGVSLLMASFEDFEGWGFPALSVFAFCRQLEFNLV